MTASVYQEFLTLVQCKNMAEAADLLSTSTSALSRHIQSLEAELGVPLFSRVGRGMTLNKYGEIFLPFAQKIAELQAETQKQLDREKNSSRYTVTVASDYQLNRLMLSFHQEHPEYFLHVIRRGNIIGHLLNGKCEIAIVSQDSDLPDNITLRPFVTDSLAVVVHREHALARQKSVHMTELTNVPFIGIASNEGDTINSTADFTNLGIEPSVVMVVATGEEAVAMVSQKIGVAILLKSLALQQNSNDIAVLDLEPPHVFQYFYATVKDRKLSAAAQTLLKHIESSYKNPQKPKPGV